MRSALAATLAATLAAFAACSHPAPSFPDLAREYVYTTLTFSPAGATQTGLHIYPDPYGKDTLRLDAMLDDFSPASRERQHAFYTDFRSRLQATKRESLDPQTRADYDLISNAVDAALFGLDRERFYERKPQLYPEVLGSALFANISLEYADTAARAAHLTARLARAPAFLVTAMANLKASNPIYDAVAVDEISGVADLIRGPGSQFVERTPSRAAYAIAQAAALSAIDRYTQFIRDSLPRLAAFDWRMGREMFDLKWKYYLQTGITPAEMLAGAQDSVAAIRTQMLALARPLHDKWFAAHHHIADSTQTLNAIVSEVMTRIGEEHSNRDSLEADARHVVDSLANFVRNKRLLSLTDFSNVKVIPTPVFMRGIYGVAGAVFAPALEPKLSSFYWVTPIPKEWAAERAAAKLREYNKYKFLSLTIHEALPGHLVQGEYANRVTPDWRRVLRAVYGNGAYVEGWAVYAEHALEQAGMNGGDSVKARLTALKGMLRIYSNVVIDAKLHTANMPTDSVVPYLVRETFQEEPEATAKLQRAELDYVQLAMYPVGLHDWWALRREAEKREGAAFNLCRYHDTVLSYGPLPVPAVRDLYLNKVAPTADMPASRCGS